MQSGRERGLRGWRIGGIIGRTAGIPATGGRDIVGMLTAPGGRAGNTGRTIVP